GPPLGLRLRGPHLAAEPVHGRRETAHGGVRGDAGGPGRRRGRREGGRRPRLLVLRRARPVGGAHGADAPRLRGPGARRHGRGRVPVPVDGTNPAAVRLPLTRAASAGRTPSGPACRPAWS